MKWNQIYAAGLVILVCVWLICSMISTCSRDKNNLSLLEKDYVYLIGYYDGKKTTSRNEDYNFVYSYNNEIYRNEVSYIMKQDFKKIYKFLGGTEKGKRFLIKICPDNPIVSKILIDYPVPTDIAVHPDSGWKNIPNWNDERAKGNVLDKPYDTSQALAYPEKGFNIFIFLFIFLPFIPMYCTKENFEKVKKLWRGKKD